MGRSPFPPDEASTPVVGVLLMVAITLVLSAAAYWSIQERFQDPPQAAAALAMDKEDDTASVTVLGGPYRERDWSSFDVQGCDAPTGPVDAGDRLTGCAGTVRVVDREFNQLVYEVEFG